MRRKILFFSLLMLIGGCSFVNYAMKKIEPYTESKYFDETNAKLDTLVMKVESVSADVDTLLYQLSPDSVMKIKNKTQLQSKLNELKKESEKIFNEVEEDIKYGEDIVKEYEKKIEEAPRAREFRGIEGKLKLVGAVKDARESIEKVKSLIETLKNLKNKKQEINEIFKKYEELIKKL